MIAEFKQMLCQCCNRYIKWLFAGWDAGDYTKEEKETGKLDTIYTI
jgi:hypothetical protein